MGNVSGRNVEIGGRRVRVRQRLAEGGFGNVYLAGDNTELYALKQMRVQRENTEMLLTARAETQRRCRNDTTP